MQRQYYFISQFWFFCLVLFFIVSPLRAFSCISQQDSLLPFPYSLSKPHSHGLLVQSNAPQKPKEAHSPHKASVYSALLPGLGQLYNKKYWKIPIVYAALGGLTYSIVFNQREFNAFQTELGLRASNDTLNLNPRFETFPDAFLTSSRNFHRNNRDLSIVALAGVYALNIVDAAVDAHLFSFDVNQSLSLSAHVISYSSSLITKSSRNKPATFSLVFRF